MKKCRITLYTLLFVVCMAFNLVPGITAKAADEAYPEIAFYSSPELSNDSLIGKEECSFEFYSGAKNVIYLYLNNIDEDYDLTLADGSKTYKYEDEEEATPVYPFTVHDHFDWDNPITGTSAGVTDYISVAPVSSKEGWYEITIDPSVTGNFTIRARAWKENITDSEDAYPLDSWIDINIGPVGLTAAMRDNPDVQGTYVGGEVYPRTIIFSLNNVTVSSTENGMTSTPLTQIDLSKIKIQRVNQEEGGEPLQDVAQSVYDIKTVESKYVSLAFRESGTYWFTYEGIGGGINVDAYLPIVGFYSTATRSDEDVTNFLDYTVSYKEAQSSSIYMLSWVGGEYLKSPLDPETIKINAYSENGSLLSDYITTEKIGTGNYKITTTSKASGTFKVVVTATINWDPEDPNSENEEIRQEIQFDGISPATPSAKPEENPATPTPTPTPTPSTPTQTPTPTLEVGATTVSGNATYQVTSADSDKKEVAYAGGNTKKKKVTIPSSVTIDGATYAVTEIAADAFSGDKKLTSVTIASTVTKIGNNAFKNCTKLKKVTIPKNVQTIGKNAFSGCKKVKTITVKSKNITKIGKNAFKGVSKNSTIKVPKSKKKAYTKLLKKAGFKGKIK